MFLGPLQCSRCHCSCTKALRNTEGNTYDVNKYLKFDQQINNYDNDDSDVDDDHDDDKDDEMMMMMMVMMMMMPVMMMMMMMIMMIKMMAVMMTMVIRQPRFQNLERGSWERGCDQGSGHHYAMTHVRP